MNDWGGFESKRRFFPSISYGDPYKVAVDCKSMVNQKQSRRNDFMLYNHICVQDGLKAASFCLHVGVAQLVPNFKSPLMSSVTTIIKETLRLFRFNCCIWAPNPCTLESCGQVIESHLNQDIKYKGAF